MTSPFNRRGDVLWAEADGSALLRPDGNEVLLSANSVANGNSFNKLAKTVSSIAAGNVTRLGILELGDSVAGYVSRQVRDYALRTYGQAGVVGLAGNMMPTIDSTSGTVTAASSAFDVALNGVAHVFSASAVRRYGVSAAPFIADKFVLYVAKRPDAGAVTVELTNSANSVTDTIATAESAAGAVGEVLVLQTTLGSPAARRIQVTCASGTISVIGMAMINTTVGGVVPMTFSMGGLELPSITATGRATAAFIVDQHEVSLATVSMREAQGAFEQYLPGLIDTFSDAGADWLLVGPTAGIVDAGFPSSLAPSNLCGLEMRRIAADRGYAFLDAFGALGSYEDILARDGSYDGNHINTSEQRTLGVVLAAGSNVFDLVSGAATRPTEYSAVRYRVRSSPYAVSGQQHPGWIETDGANLDLILRPHRWLTVKDQASGTRQLLVSHGTNNGQERGVILGASVSAFATRLSNYAQDGDWTIAVNGTTGVATLYARVGGAVKSLALGTLA